ncbi:MAG TPA: heliorhodopsin HeR [Dermatophilaceae bacterium]|nr:heliorhodopsin HeR [Dermatophilaceae bacterium]
MNQSSSETRSQGSPTAYTPVDSGRLAGLRRYNIIVGIVLIAQAVVVYLLSNDFTLPVTAAYLQGPPGTTPGDPVTLVNTQIGLAVAGFLALSGLALLIVSTVWSRGYAADLARQRNRARWVEYALTSSMMIVLIAQLTGISDVAALAAIFGVNAAMIFFGWLQENYEQPGGGLLPFIFGSMVGIVPWLIIAFFVVAPGSTSPADPPAFVYGIIVSLFLFFNVFALNQYLQYKQVGRWADYLVGERTYITLSLVAKSLLAWQVFGGALAG